MKAIILAAGFGTRLYPITRHTPKALLDVGGKPLLDYLMDALSEIRDVKEIILVTNGRFYADFLRWKDELGNPDSIHIVNNGAHSFQKKLGAVNDLFAGLKHKTEKEGDYLVLSADNYFDFSLDDFLHEVRMRPSLPLIGVYDVESNATARNYGVVSLKENGEIFQVEEKPLESVSTLVSIGIYYLPKEFKLRVWEYLELEKNDTDRIGDFISWLVRKEPVYGHVFQGIWFDVGDVFELEEARRIAWTKPRKNRSASIFSSFGAHLLGGEKRG